MADKSFNEYASWSVALQALQKQESLGDRPGLNELAFNYDDQTRTNEPMTFTKWNEVATNFTKDTDFRSYKKIDLGGGDQKKLFYDAKKKKELLNEIAKLYGRDVPSGLKDLSVDVLDQFWRGERKWGKVGRWRAEVRAAAEAAAEAAPEKKGKLMENIRKLYNQEDEPSGLEDLSVDALDQHLVAKEYSKLTGVLFTAGNNEERKQNIQNIRTKISDILSAHESPVLNTGIYALNIDMETKLTALSYYDKAKDLLLRINPTYKKLVLIPIGSTDLHIITYNKDGKNVVVDRTNYANFGKLGNEEKPENWKDPLAKTDTTEPIDSYWDRPGQATSEPDTIVVFAGSSTYYFGDFIKYNGDKNIMTIQDIIDAINDGDIQNSKRKDLLKFLNICEDKAAQFMFMSGRREAKVAAIRRDTINVVFPTEDAPPSTERPSLKEKITSMGRSAVATFRRFPRPRRKVKKEGMEGGRSRRRRSRRNKKKTKRRAKNNKKRKKSRRRKIRKTRVKHKK